MIYGHKACLGHADEIGQTVLAVEKEDFAEKDFQRQNTIDPNACQVGAIQQLDELAK